MDAGDDEAVDEESITDAQKQFKRDHASLRARVETPFAWLKNAFKAFSGVWNEGDDQIDCAVRIPIAILNMKS